MEMINNEPQPFYSPEATQLVDRYRQMLSSINLDEELSEAEREGLQVEAGQWYEKHVLGAGFTEHQLTWAWFANSSEDEWPDPWAKAE